MLELIKIMHDQFGITHEEQPSSDEERAFRHAAFVEEAGEYLNATTDAERLDALVDLVVFALGAAEREGYLPLWHVAFSRVMEANLNKRLGPNAKRGSYNLDLQKPEGWEPPDLQSLFERPKWLSC